MMLCRIVKVEIFEESSVADLQTEVNAWLEARDEEVLVDIDYEHDSTTTFWAFVTYIEE